MVTHYCCSRVIKEAAALKDGGDHWIGVLTNKKGAAPVFDGVYYYNDIATFERQVRRIKADIYHCHNEPNWPTEVTLRINPGPVIYDVHDLDFVRFGGPADWEMGLVGRADGVIVPCRSYQKALGDKGAVVYTMVPRGYIHWNSRPEDGMIMAGHVRNNDPRAAWLDYRDVCLRFRKAWKPLFIQPSDEKQDTKFENSAAHVLRTASYDGMMHNIRRFRWGLCSGGVPNPQSDMSMPNKLFEYLVSGTVPVVMWEREAAEYVTKYGVGVVLAEPEDAPKKLTEKAWKDCRRNLKRLQDTFTMETQVGAILRTYGEAKERWAKSGQAPGTTRQ